MKRIAVFVTLAFLATSTLLTVSAGAHARKKKKDTEEVDHVGLAAVLLRDGHYDRAAAVLKQADPADENIDLPRYWTVKGLIHLFRDQHSDAVSAFQRALDAGQTDPTVYLYLAQAHLGAGAFDAALRTLDAGGEPVAAMSGSWLVRAQAHWKSGDMPAAWAALEHGRGLFPEHAAFARHEIFLLIEMGLYQAAVDLGRGYLARESVVATDYMGIAEALSRAGQQQEAAAVLEEARLRFPAHDDITVQLAHTYLRDDEPLAAAGIFSDAAMLDPSHSEDAAELYRRAGQLERALFLNAQVADPKAKFRQRMGMLVQLDRFEQAAALEPRLRRLGLLEDQDVAYALAYALYRIGRFDAAEGYLKRIQRPDLFENATSMREAMASCRESGWSCE